MSTTSNQILWAIRGIEDTATLRTAIVELERILYHTAYNSNYEVNTHLSEALKEASVALVVLTDELLELRNTELETGLYVGEVDA